MHDKLSSMIKKSMYVIIAIASFFIAFLTIKIQVVNNFEYQLIDAAKFALKEQTKHSTQNRDLINSEIIILGITEASQFYYLNNIYGQYPWPREAYSDFLRYFRLDEPNLLEEQIQELELITWNSIRPDMLFFDIFFDSPRNTKLSFKENNISKDFGSLISKLKSSKNNINITELFKEWTKKKRYEADNKFYDELRKQKKHSYIFFDYIVGERKEGRLSEEDIKVRFPYLKDWELTNVYNKNGEKVDAAQDLDDYPYIGLDIKLPLKNIIENAAGVGAANIHPDPDGKNRKIPLVYRVFDERVMSKPIFLPTINLMMAAKYYGIKANDIIINIGNDIVIKNALLRKRIYYTRKDKYDREYRWSEYIDPFMESIIKNIISVKDSSAGQTLKYTDIINTLIEDNKSIEILQEKYEKNNLNVKINRAIYKKEIEDFLSSLSLTSFYSKERFFELENNALTRISTNTLKDYLKDLKNTYAVLKHLIRKEVDDDNKTQVLFIDNKMPRISIKDVKSYKELFFELAARLSTRFSLYDEERIVEYKRILYKEGLTNEEDNASIVDVDKITRYKNKLKDSLFKGYIDYLLAVNELPSIMAELESQGMISYREENKDFFEISIINNDLNNLIYLDEDSTKQKSTLDKIYSLMGVGNTDNKKSIKDILLYLSGAYSDSIEPQDLELFYSSLKEAYNIEEALVKKTIDTLISKKLISYKIRKQKIVFLEIIDLEKINKYKDNKINNLAKRKIVQGIIRAAERLKELDGEDGKYYTLSIKEIIDYLYDKTKLSKDIIKNILSNTSISKMVKGNIRTIDIKMTDKDLGIKQPLILINYIDSLSSQIKIIEELGKLENESPASPNTPSSEENNNFYLYDTVSKIAEATDIKPSNVLTELEYLLSVDPVFTEIVKKVEVKEEDRFVKIDKDILRSYLNKKIEISIPIDNKGQMIINYQGPHKAFENSHFGKYMSTSRLRYIEDVQGIIPKPFDMPEETPHLNWELFKNKIVFIGFYTTSALGQSRDYFETPYGTLFGVEIHANALNTLLKRDFISTLPMDTELLSANNFSGQTKNLWFVVSIIIILSFLYYSYRTDQKKKKKKKIKTILKESLFPIVLFSILSYSLLSILNGGFLLDYEVLIMLLFSLLFAFLLPRVSIAKGFISFLSIFLIYFVFVIFYAFSILKIDIPIVGTSFSMFYTFLSISVYKLIVEEKEKRKIKNMFSKYVSPELVKQLVASSKGDLELGGEDKEITVLFSDIRKFTSISENLTPHELVSHLNVYFTKMTQIIQEYNGTLDKYIGDAIMAFWGAPLDIKDHALLACKSAIGMMNSVNNLNASWPSDRQFNIGIGINTGIVTVGNIGSLSRMDYTIMGDSVNLCSRVEGANKMYGTDIIITEFTYDLVKDDVIVRELDLIKVVGKEKPVRIYELLSVINK